jgi:hypothetical protein
MPDSTKIPTATATAESQRARSGRRSLLNTAALGGAVAVVAAVGFAENANASGVLYCHSVHPANKGCNHTYAHPHYFAVNSARNQAGHSACIDAVYGTTYGNQHCAFGGNPVTSYLGSESRLGFPTPLVGRCWNGGGAAGGTSIHCRYSPPSQG